MVVPGGACVVAWGGQAWLLRGGMHACSCGGHGCSLGGACVVARGDACLLPRGGMHACSCGGHGCSLGGACVVARGGSVHGCSGGHAWLLWGGGGVHGCSGGGHAWLLGGRGWACVVFWGGVRGFFDEIRSMSGRYASYWNAFLSFQFVELRQITFAGVKTKKKASGSRFRNFSVTVKVKFIYL